MPQLMRCLYCGTLQDEPSGAKTCALCGGELAFEQPPPPDAQGSYIQAQLELDQVNAPAGKNIERHLLVTLRSPAQVPEPFAANTDTGRPPMAFTAVLDISGSMSGEKIIHAKEAVRQAVHSLHSGDFFSLVVFSSDVRTVLEPGALDANLRKRVESLLGEITPTGMTALDGGLQAGIEKGLRAAQASNLVLLLSDGQANVGETDLEKIGARAAQARAQGLTVSCLGVGSDYNEALLSEVASQGGGRYYHVQQPAHIVSFLSGELGEMAGLAARELHIHLELPLGAVVQTLSTAYPATQDGAHADILVGDMPADLEMEIPIRLLLTSQKEGQRLPIRGAATYQSPGGSRLTTALNPVTLRIVSAQQFRLRDGVATPVVERVLAQLKAAAVLTTARAMSQAPAQAAQAHQTQRDHLQAYAQLLGDDRALKEASELDSAYQAIASPASPAAKQSVAAAHAFVRSARPPKNQDR